MSDLQTIEAWFAISQAKARYCRTMDTKDWAGLEALLTEDFEMDISEASGLPLIVGRDEAMKEIRSSIETALTAHQVHFPEIELNGDEARVIFAAQDRIIWGTDKPSIVAYGHYHERWVRRDGEWKLAALRLTRLHLDVLPPVDG